MPVAKEPVVAGVSFQWLGERVKTRIRAGVRAGMDDAGQHAVAIARRLVHSPENSSTGEATGALQAAITYRVPTAVAGLYRLEFGVDPAIGSEDIGTRPGNPPWEYAFWQETLPPPVGSSFLRPAADIAFADIGGDIRERIAFRRGPLAGGLEAEFDIEPIDEGFAQ